MNIHTKTRSLKIARMTGFTLLELTIAMSMFVVVGGAAFLLFRQAVPVYAQQQNLASVNIGVQNAVSQLQQDLVNAGTGYYAGANIPSWPVGITITNTNAADTSSCVTGSPWVYASACFDSFSIITTDPNTTPQHLATGTDTHANTSLLLYTPGLTAGQLTTLSQSYKTGDELLLVSVSGLQMTSILLNGNGSVVGGSVKLTYNVTNADGTNSSTNDPDGITTNASTSDNGAAVFYTSYGNSDWILRLQPIKYQVDTTNASNPVLERVQNGVTSVLAQQIIGFRVGAALWNNPVGDSDAQKYNYQASTYGTGYDFTIIRSIRVSIIGRTTPGTSGIYNYQNSFDGGPYQVMGAAVVVNPRNLSMADSFK